MVQVNDMANNFDYIKEAREIEKLLISLGLKKEAQLIDISISCGSVGGEICMALAFHSKNISENPKIPELVRKKLTNLRKKLDLLLNN